MVTWGNAMKMDAIVSASGNLNFGNLDPALKQLKDDGVDLYGHNFLAYPAATDLFEVFDCSETRGGDR